MTHDSPSRPLPSKTRIAMPNAARLALPLALAAALLGGCTVGPDYVRPDTDVPAAYKEDSLWKTARPADEYPRGQWWRVFHDPELDRLMELHNRQNLTIAQSEAQYRQAQAMLRQAESALFPTLSMDANRSRGVLSGNSMRFPTKTSLSVP